MRALCGLWRVCMRLPGNPVEAVGRSRGLHLSHFLGHESLWLDVGFVGCMGFTRSGMPETCSDGSQSGAVSRALLVQMHGAPILTILSGPRTIRLEFQQRAGRPTLGNCTGNTMSLHLCNSILILHLLL